MNRSFKKTLAALIERLRAMEADGRLEPGQREALVKAIKEMWHAIKVNDQKEWLKAADDFCRNLYRQ